MEDPEIKKVKIKVVDIIKKLDKSAPTFDLIVEKKEEEKNEEVVAQGKPSQRQQEKKEKPQKKNNDLEKLFERIDRKEREVLGKNVSQKTIEREIPHLREDSIQISLPPRLSQTLPKKKRRFAIVIWATIFVLLGLGAYGAWAYLPKSDIKIEIKKFRWDYDNPINLSSKLTDVDINTRQIPIAIFSQKKNTNFTYQASGKKYIERKANGGIIIFNAYSTDQQILISGTRFKSPDGKIFKLTDRVVVPGARVDNGQVIPASVEAQVVAEKAGEPYNIGAVSRFSIPGFEGTVKYDKFYAQSKTPISGGFIGEAAYPTDSDIKSAKDGAEKTLRGAIEAFIISQISSEEFKIIDSSKQFNISKETINVNTDENGNFSVYVEGDLSLAAFKKSQMLGFLTQTAKQVINTPLNIVLKKDDYSINYGSVAVDPKTKVMTLPVKFSGVFWQPLDVGVFKEKILGKSEADLKTIIYSYSNIEKADFSFWPFWVLKVPTDQNRVNITIN